MLFHIGDDTAPPTPTIQPIPDVIINEIEPGEYYDEYVRVKNRARPSKVDMSGWTIEADKSGTIYTFPDDYKVQPNAAVRGDGRNLEMTTMS